MKKLALLFFFFSINAFGAQGVIRVLEAPLLDRPSMEANVVDTRKEGEKIYLHDKDISKSMYQPHYGENPPPGRVEDDWNQEGFFQTLDSSSSTAYIEKRYVKIIYNDAREQATSLRPYKKDPTDYRLEEPLSEEYPVYDPRKRRATLALVTGPARQVSYGYNRNIIRDEQDSRKGITGSYTAKVGDDPSNRFYFGGQFHFQFQSSGYFLSGNAQSEESFGQLGAGPVISYNYFRSKNYRLTVGGGLTLNFHRALVSIQDFNLGVQEERLFEGFSLTPKLKTHMVRSNLIPSVDLIAGVELQMNLSHSLKAAQDPAFEQLWNSESDTYNFPTGGIFAFFFGVQSSY